MGLQEELAWLAQNDYTTPQEPTLSEQKQQRLDERTAAKAEKQVTVEDVYRKGMQQKFDALALLNTQNIDLISKTSNPDGTGNIFGEDKPLGLNVERAVTGGYGAYGRPLSDARGIGGKSIYNNFNTPTEDSDYYSKYPEGTIPTNFQPAVLDKVTDMDTLQFRGVTGGEGKYNNLTGKLTGDRQVGLDAFEVPHDGSDYLSTANGRNKINRQIAALNGSIGTQTSQPFTPAELAALGDTDSYIGNLIDGAESGALTTGAGIADAFTTLGATAVHNTAKALGMEHYYTAEEANIAKNFFDKYQDSEWADKTTGYDRKPSEKLVEGALKDFNNGNYFSGLWKGAKAGPDVFMQSIAYMGAAATGTGFVALVASEFDDSLEAYRKNNNNREPGVADIARIAAVDTLKVGLERIPFMSAVKGKSATIEAMTKLMNSVPKSKKLAFGKEMAKKIATVGLNIGEEASQESVQYAMDYFNREYGTAKDKGFNWDEMYKSAIAGGAAGGFTGSVGATKDALLGDTVSDVVTATKDKFNDLKDTPVDSEEAVNPTPMADAVKGMSTAEAGEFMQSKLDEFNAAVTDGGYTSAKEYMDTLPDHEKADFTAANKVYKTKLAEEAVDTGNTDTLGATPEMEEAIITAYAALDDDDKASTFKANILKRTVDGAKDFDSDLTLIMKKADEARAMYKELSGMERTRKEVALSGMDDERKGFTQYFRDALSEPVDSPARQRSVSKLLKFTNLQITKKDKLDAGNDKVIAKVADKIDKIAGHTGLDKEVVWKAMVKASSSKSAIATKDSFKDELSQVLSKGYTAKDLSVVGEMTPVRYASDRDNRKNKGYESRDDGTFEVNHEGTLIDYAKKEGLSLEGISPSWQSGSRALEASDAIAREIRSMGKALDLIDKNTARKSGAEPSSNTSPEVPTEPVKEETPAGNTNVPVEPTTAPEAATVSPTLSSSIATANSIQGTNVDTLNSVQKAQYEEVQQAVKDGTVVANTVGNKTTYSMAPEKPVEPQTPTEQPSTSEEPIEPSVEAEKLTGDDKRKAMEYNIAYSIANGKPITDKDEKAYAESNKGKIQSIIHNDEKLNKAWEATVARIKANKSKTSKVKGNEDHVPLEDNRAGLEADYEAAADEHAQLYSLDSDTSKYNTGTKEALLQLFRTNENIKRILVLAKIDLKDC